jgi:hypothetical protein
VRDVRLVFEGVYFDDTGALTQDEVLSAIVDENERRTQR